MNLGAKSQNGILFANFNQDFSCISVGTRTGYKIYNSDPFGKCYAKQDGGIGIVEMLFCTSLVALVGAGEQPAFSPRRLQIINTKRQSTICELTFATAILAVKLNRKRLVVVLEEHIYIYDIGNMKLMFTIDTSPNPNALCSLSPSSENCYFAYPSNTSTSSGELLIFDAINLQAVNIIPAHKSPLSCVAFNYDGTLVATASDKGTVIRVFSVPQGQKLFQFRRGTYPARIFSMAFNLESTMLAISSDSDTVHIFKLDDKDKVKDPNAGPSSNERQPSAPPAPTKRSSVIDSIRSPLVSAAGAMGSYLMPEMIADMWEPTRDFAFAKIPSASKSIQNMCSLSTGAGVPQLSVATADGSFYVYNVQEAGGECVLVKQHTILDSDEDLWCVFLYAF
ncbi:autophagy protein [Polyrhizophydium stewartii]|uniref:Autophagy protein n=1 Tax=Polyrhizophydium stewartii TaxID=2732419 RepID=A0ABR4N8X2_9FUNG